MQAIDCTHSRDPVFVSPAIVDITLRRFLQSAAQADVEVSAYCFMPDHLHLLIDSETVGDLDQFMRRAKQASGHSFKQSGGRPLWQTGYHERVLRSDEDRLSVIAYMVANPIRAGLVTRAGDWPFWGSQCYSREDILDAIAVRGTNCRG